MSRINSSRRIPTAEDLVDLALGELEGVSEDERLSWYRSPLTKALMLLLESERMTALEALEGAPEENMARMYMAKAALANDLMDEIYTHLVEEPENVYN
jgi:hypothetical protein